MEKTEGRGERPHLRESLTGFLGEFGSIKTSRWKIVFSYFYLGALSYLDLYSLLSSTQIFQFSSPSWDITQFNWLCLAAPCAKTPLQFPSSPYFQPSATPHLLELSEVSL